MHIGTRDSSQVQRFAQHRRETSAAATAAASPESVATPGASTSGDVHSSSGTAADADAAVETASAAAESPTVAAPTPGFVSCSLPRCGEQPEQSSD